MFRNRRGSATLYTIVMLGIIAVIALAVMSFVVSQIRYSLSAVHRAAAVHYADAGVHYYLWYLAHQTDGKTVQQVESFWSSGTAYGASEPYTQSVGQGKFSLSVTPPLPGQTAVTITSRGWREGAEKASRTIRARLRRPSWSEYAALINDNVRFGDGTEVFGPLHSNGGIRFDGVAHNTVSSARTTYTDPDTGQVKDGVWTAWSNGYNTTMHSNVFLAGTSFPVTAKDFSGVAADIALMRSTAQDTGTYHSGGVGQRILLQGTTYTVQTVAWYNTSSNSILSLSGSPSTAVIPDNGVIYVEGHAWVSGTLTNRRLTIVAARTGAGMGNVYIGNSITYGAYDGTATLGLLAEGDVEIIRDSQDDLRIDAALLAQSGRVGRSYYGTYCTQWWWWICLQYATDHKTRITVYGAIASNGRYGFAWTDGTGYAQRVIIYDNNLLYAPPPYFPTGTHYIPDLWEEI